GTAAEAHRQHDRAGGRRRPPQGARGAGSLMSESAHPAGADPSPPLSVPRHVAIIMDGNGRWARQRGLPQWAGHRAGTKNIRKIVENSVELGIEVLTLYAFSTENWQRPGDEVNGLLALL